MEELLSITIPIKNIKKEVKKKVAKKISNLDNNCQLDKLNKSNIINLVEHPKPINITAYYLNTSSGYFLNKDDPVNDYFYRCLESLYKQHCNLLEECDNYNKPYTPQSFKFKSTKKILICKDKTGMIKPSECKNKKCIFTLRIKPYHVENRYGLTILVSEIYKL